MTEQTGTATVLSRRVECTWVVAFRLASGEELELNVSQDRYRDLREGTCWGLRWKGTELLDATEKE